MIKGTMKPGSWAAVLVTPKRSPEKWAPTISRWEKRKPPVRASLCNPRPKEISSRDLEERTRVLNGFASSQSHTETKCRIFVKKKISMKIV